MLPPIPEATQRRLQCSNKEPQIKKLLDIDFTKEGLLRETQRQKGKQNQGQCGNLKPLATKALTNIKHSPAPSQVDINPHNEGLFTSISIAPKSRLALNKN